MGNFNDDINTANIDQYSRFRIVFYSTLSILIFVTHMLISEYKISPNFIDYAIFYTAAKFALAGNAVAAYDIQLLGKSIEILTGYHGESIPMAWLYQPYVLLFFMPLAILPYSYSVTIWLLSGSAIYILCGYKYARNKFIILLLIAFPGFWYNILWGQQTFFWLHLLDWLSITWTAVPYYRHSYLVYH